MLVFLTVVNSVNALFELVGAILAWVNARAAAEAKPIGVSPAMVAFSALWAVWCLPYYLAHGDNLSAAFACVRCTGHLLWCWRAR